jgi:hypothetical protein
MDDLLGITDEDGLWDNYWTDPLREFTHDTLLLRLERQFHFLHEDFDPDTGFDAVVLAEFHLGMLIFRARYHRYPDLGETPHAVLRYADAFDYPDQEGGAPHDASRAALG